MARCAHAKPGYADERIGGAANGFEAGEALIGGHGSGFLSIPETSSSKRRLNDGASVTGFGAAILHNIARDSAAAGKRGLFASPPGVLSMIGNGHAANIGSGRFP
jgi:hypothetical protein